MAGGVRGVAGDFGGDRGVPPQVVEGVVSVEVGGGVDSVCGVGLGVVVGEVRFFGGELKGPKGRKGAEGDGIALEWG